MMTTICNLILATQLEACRTTLNYATRDYQRVLTAKAEKLQLKIENELPKYSNYVIITGKALYEGKFMVKNGPVTLTLRKDSFACIWHWTL